MYRTRKLQKAYTKRLEHHDPSIPSECDFCQPQKADITIEAEYEHCYVMKNTYPYSQWEYRKVIEHLMLIPRRHVGSLTDLTAEESVEIMALLGEYEQEGYDLYARSRTSTVRTLPHQHTHLFKTEGKHARGAMYWRKPYILKLFR